MYNLLIIYLPNIEYALSLLKILLCSEKAEITASPAALWEIGNKLVLDLCHISIYLESDTSLHSFIITLKAK